MSKARIVRKHNRTFTRDQLPKGRESVESHAQFLQLNWRLLAALAWNGYRTQGRGAVVIDAAHALDAPVGAPWEAGYTEGTHIPLADLERLGIAATHEKRLITQYAPEQEIVEPKKSLRGTAAHEKKHPRSSTLIRRFLHRALDELEIGHLGGTGGLP